MEVEGNLNQSHPALEEVAPGQLDELQKAITDRQKEIDTLKAAAASMEATLRDLTGSLKEAVTEYRNALILAHPDVLPELIAGDTVPSVRESVTRARAIVDKVKQNVEAQISYDKFPTGSPARGSAADLGLSPREKIERGISGQRQ